MTKNTNTHLIININDSIIELTLDRPTKMNFLSFDMLTELQNALDMIANDKSIRVVILSDKNL